MWQRYNEICRYLLPEECNVWFGEILLSLQIDSIILSILSHRLYYTWRDHSVNGYKKLFKKNVSNIREMSVDQSLSHALWLNSLDGVLNERVKSAWTVEYMWPAGASYYGDNRRFTAIPFIKASRNMTPIIHMH